jgi:hypothetical protein
MVKAVGGGGGVGHSCAGFDHSLRSTRSAFPEVIFSVASAP